MKYNTLSIILAAAAILAACHTKERDEREDMDSRTVSQLEVYYELDGQAVEALSFTHEYSKPVIQVVVNSEGLRWNLESNRSWCKVIEAPHRGPGTITLELEANESFVDRSGLDAATLTFVAGDFRGFRITLTQTASAFILSQPYFMAGKDGGDFLVDVTTPDGVDWSFSSDASWLEASVQGTPVSDAGQTVTTLKLSAGADDGASRLGTLTLSAGAEKEVINLWQFGTDFTWDGEDILLPSGEGETFSFVVPHGLVKKVDMPKFASYTIQPQNDLLDRIVFTLDKNYSDMEQTRTVPVTLTLSNNAETLVPLPSMKQDFTPAGALVTPEGLQLFAQKVAAGEPTTNWETDGWVTMMGDIDMAGVEGWAGIGTEEHPFSGMFDGKGHSILNLKKSPNGLFNYVKGADESDVAIIQNLTLDSSCSFYANKGDWTGGACLGAFANQAINASIVNCSNGGNIQLLGTSDDDSPVWVGGILGKGAENVSVRGCATGETVTITFSAVGEKAYVGGVAGAAPFINGSSMKGFIKNTGNFSDLYLGGVTGLLQKDGTVSGNQFSGTIDLQGGCTNNYLGGLYGATEADAVHGFNVASDASAIKGTINVTNYQANATTRIYAGGFIGYAASGSDLSFDGYEARTDILLDHSVAKAADYCCVGGILGGCDPSSPAKNLSFDNLTVKGAVTINLLKGTTKTKTAIVHNCYGGVVGLVNGPASCSNCANEVAIGHLFTSAQEGGTNNYNYHYLGGIVGYAYGGNLTLTSCSNSATISNVFYVNSVYYRAKDKSGNEFGFQGAGGIVGAFNANGDAEDIKMTLTSCTNTGTVSTFRGFAGGMTSFCQNAEFSQCICNNPAALFDAGSQGFIQGGIAGLVFNASFEACKVKGNVPARALGNSNDYGSNAAGIVARVDGAEDCTVNGCFFYGQIDAQQDNSRPQNGGGIVGFATAKTSVANCKIGGTIQGSPATSDNVADLAVGNKAVEATNTELWDGNI